MTAARERKINTEGTLKESRICPPNSPTLGSFWQAIGRREPFCPPPPREIEEMIDRVFFSATPLYPLAPDEEQRLRKYLNDLTSKRLWDNSLALAAKPMIMRREIEKDVYGIPLEEDVFYSGEEAERLHAEGCPYLMPAEKIALFTDPMFWRKRRVVQQGNGHWEQMHGCLTNRPFIRPQGQPYADNYGIRFEEIDPFIVEKNKQGVVPLVADLGGDMGRALTEVSKHYRSQGLSVDGINITVEEPLAKYPGMIHLVAAAERLPSYLFEKADVFISRAAFMHFLYPDAALKNVLLALKIGGYANFDFQLSHNAQNWNHFQRITRIGIIKRTIDNLTEKDLISVDFYHQNYEGLEHSIDIGDFFEDLAYRWSGLIPRLKIRKQAPIRAQDLSYEG